MGYKVAIYMNALAIGFHLLLIFDQKHVRAQRNARRRPDIPQTKFNCAGRPSGYYADIDLNCEVYHMCDELGRQFSYSCPNTTLFQQRMLICDHWYMVNCSKAEKDYSANLLIGQRDKPFVRDDEHELRTPRPDLLDRPYAPDYAGESFRKQYRTISQSINTISDLNQKPSSIHNKIVESTTAPIANINFGDFDNSGGNDLKASSSQDSRRSQNEAVFDNKVIQNVKTTPKPLIIEYQPPFLHPIFNLKATNDGESVNNVELSEFSTNVQTTTEVSTDFNRGNINLQNETRRQGTNEEKIRNRPSSVTSSVINFGERLQPTANPIDNSIPISSDPPTVIKNSNKSPELETVLLPPYENLNIYDTTTQGPPIYYEWKIPASFLEPPHDENKSNGAITISDNKIPVIPSEISSSTNQQSVSIPFLDKDLVPPLFDASTTQNNVKLPSVSLQPPFFGSVHGTHNSSVPSSSNHSFSSITSPNANAIQQTASTDQNIQIVDNELQTLQSTTGRDTANSITTNRLNDHQQHTTNRNDLNYLDLKKHFLIPEYTFPLENIHRPSYTENNALNSFQIKIPDEVVGQRRQDDNSELSSTEKLKQWYGENTKCPECHPSFLKLGSCEPCIKFR